MTEQSLQATETTTPDAVQADAVVENEVPQSSPAEDVKQEAEEGSNTNDNLDDAAEKPKSELTDAEKKAYALEKRLARKTAAEKAKEKRIAELEAQLAEMPKAAEKDDAPNEDDFDSWDDYNRAVIKYEAKKIADTELRRAKEVELKRSQEARVAEEAKAFSLKEAAFAKDVPDYTAAADAFTEVINSSLAVNGGATPTLEAVREVILDSEFAPALIHHLGNDDAAADDLLNMTPVQARRELFKLESIVSSKPKQERKEMPQPIKPLGGNSKPNKSLEQMSPQELLARFSKIVK
jgi:hypothetical protein